MSIENYSLKATCECDEVIHIEIANILSQQWPAINFAKRIENIISSKFSYVLIKNVANGDTSYSNRMVFGYAEIKSAVEQFSHDAILDDSDQQKSAIMVSVIIHPRHRGQGLGRILVSLVEAKFLELGYINAYLWTEDARDFYAKLGYKESNPVLINVPAFKLVDASALDNLFRARFQRKSSSVDSKSYDNNNMSIFESSRNCSPDGKTSTNSSKSCQQVDVITTKNQTASTSSIVPPISDITTVYNKRISVWMCKRLLD